MITRHVLILYYSCPFHENFSNEDFKLRNLILYSLTLSLIPMVNRTQPFYIQVRVPNKLFRLVAMNNQRKSIYGETVSKGALIVINNYKIFPLPAKILNSLYFRIHIVGPLHVSQ